MAVVEINSHSTQMVNTEWKYEARKSKEDAAHHALEKGLLLGIHIRGTRDIAKKKKDEEGEGK